MSNCSLGVGWGFGAAAVSTVFFGSNFVPVKKIETGDGVFFQFVMCCTILLGGLVVHAIRSFPTFYPIVMVGGAMWAIGNMFVIPIIKTIGLGLGFLIWGAFNMLSGWASGRFGLFGIKKDDPPREIVNYIGIALCAISGIVYMFVRTEVSQEHSDFDEYFRACESHLYVENDVSAEPLMSEDVNQAEELNPSGRPRDMFDSWSTMKKRIVGCSMAAFAGCLFGFSFSPYLYVVNNYEGASDNGLDYVFTQFVGTFITSFLIFIIYCMIKRNQPDVFPKSVLPGVASGLMWTIADVGFFIATDCLGETISFPIITTAPPIITNLWTILLFKEIQGKRNLLVCGLAYLVSCGGVAAIVVSKLR